MYVEGGACSIVTTIPAAIVPTMECCRMLRLGLTDTVLICLDLRKKPLSGQSAEVEGAFVLTRIMSTLWASGLL